MATVPSTQKFHTVSADADTKERGSALVDGLREVYTMADIAESVPQGTFKAVSSGAHSKGEVVYITGFDSTDNLPIVSGTNNAIASEDVIVGVVATASTGRVTDVIVSGSHEVIFQTEIGVAPVAGNTVFAGAGGHLYDSSASGYGAESLPVGKVIDFTFVQTVAGYYDEYKGNVLFEMPSNNAFYKDGISFCSSERFNQGKSGTVNEGDIVMYASTGIDSGKVLQWASAYTDYRIAGVATSGLDSLSVSICTSGLVKLPTSVLVSQSGFGVGQIIYADSTDDYKLTTDSTSGTKIGIVHSWFANDSTFIMQVKL
jgi:hypothetical protein